MLSLHLKQSLKYLTFLLETARENEQNIKKNISNAQKLWTCSYGNIGQTPSYQSTIYMHTLKQCELQYSQLLTKKMCSYTEGLSY